MKSANIQTNTINEKTSSLILHYKQNIVFSINLYIKFIRENKFPYQLAYWKEKLLEALKIRSKILKKINELKVYFSPVQLTLF